MTTNVWSFWAIPSWALSWRTICTAASRTKPEGELTRIRADLVCEKNLARAAATIRLGSFLLLGHGEEHGGGRKRDSIVSDAMESVIAASYMDGGFSAAKEIIDRLILCDVPAGKPHNFDYKTALQELVQRKKDQVLRYELIGESRPRPRQEI